MYNTLRYSDAYLYITAVGFDRRSDTLPRASVLILSDDCDESL